MNTRLRAAMALVLMAAFYPIAVGVVLALGVLIVWLAVHLPPAVRTGAMSGLVLSYAGVVAAVGSGLLAMVRQRPEPEGLPLPEELAPELWARLRHPAAHGRPPP